MDNCHKCNTKPILFSLSYLWNDARTWFLNLLKLQVDSVPVTPAMDCCFPSVPFIDELDQMRQVTCRIFM